MKLFLINLLCLTALPMLGQQMTVKGMVADMDHEPLIGATIYILGTETGTTTDVTGHFQINITHPNDKLIVSYVGFRPDTLAAVTSRPMHILLAESNSELGAVTIQSSSTFIDNVEPIHAEVITEKELLKAACCNLSESFETNASVDVSFTDAVTGTKMIRMLGLDGKYTLINRENLPAIRGLNSRQGLNYIAGTWIQSIDVGKGAGTVVNGYESMAGQINVELKKPESSESLYLNSYVNSFGRAELNANTAFKLTDKISTALLTNVQLFNNEVDVNDDGFMDLPKTGMVNVLNRYKYSGDRIESQLGFNISHSETAGGQLGFDFNEDAATSGQYGYANEAMKAEVFGKLGVLFPEAPYKGWGFIYSASIQKQDMAFGRTSYSGNEKTIYTNMIHQNIFGSTFHQYKLGASFLADIYDETYADSTFIRNEIVPGTFFEYTFLPNDDFTLVAGSRLDFHNLYGIYFTPRLHLRYQLLPTGTLRLSAGKGYRTANIIPENNQALISSRRLVVEEALQPEESWNFGGSYVQELQVANRKVNLTADYFHTRFQNQVITDLDQNPGEVRFYNLDGRSLANSFQLEAGVALTDRLSTKAAYKYYDVRSTINGKFQPVPFIAKDRLFWNLSYSSKYDIWNADLTGQWYGRKRLPDTQLKPEEFQKPDYSPDFITVNAQVSREFRWGNVYLGSENLLDFRQDDPIVNPDDPFSTDFDGSLVWGPVAGRVIYFGARYRIQ